VRRIFVCCTRRRRRRRNRGAKRSEPTNLKLRTDPPQQNRDCVAPRHATPRHVPVDQHRRHWGSVAASSPSSSPRRAARPLVYASSMVAAGGGRRASRYDASANVQPRTSNPNSVSRTNRSLPRSPLHSTPLQSRSPKLGAPRPPSHPKIRLATVGGRPSLQPQQSLLRVPIHSYNYYS